MIISATYPQVITFITAIKTAGSGIQTINIAPIGKDILFEEDEICIKTTRSSFNLVLTEDVSATATTMSVRGDIPQSLPKFSYVSIISKGMAIKASSKRLYAHQSIYLTAGTNGNDYLSAFGTSTFSVNAAAQLADGNSKPNRWGSQYGMFVAPYDCELLSVKGTASTNAGTGDNALINIWKTTPNVGTTTNLTIDLMKQFTITSQNNQNHIFDLEATTFSGPALTSGDIVFFSIRRTGTKSGGVKWYADIGLQIEMFR